MHMVKTCGEQQAFERAKSNNERRRGGVGERRTRGTSGQRFWSLPNCLACVLEREQHTGNVQNLLPSSAEEVGGEARVLAAVLVSAESRPVSVFWPPQQFCPLT